MKNGTVKKKKEEGRTQRKKKITNNKSIAWNTDYSPKHDWGKKRGVQHTRGSGEMSFSVMVPSIFHYPDETT